MRYRFYDDMIISEIHLDFLLNLRFIMLGVICYLAKVNIFNFYTLYRKRGTSSLRYYLDKFIQSKLNL